MAKNKLCFFDVATSEQKLGRIVVSLFNEICPKTCENFLQLCTGQAGIGKLTGKPLHYKGCKFHRVIKNFMIQSGDFSKGTGQGGESIYSGTFDDENFNLKHDEPFMLSMANRGRDTNGSQFFITTKPTPHLDGVHVVFGKVISGQEVVTMIENVEVDRKARPLVDVIIEDCGVLEEVEDEKEKKRRLKKEKKAKKKAKKKEKKRKKKRHHHSSSSDSSEAEDGQVDKKKQSQNEDDDEEPPAPQSSIRADEIPPVPVNRFLMRNTQPLERRSEQESKDRRPERESKERSSSLRDDERSRTHKYSSRDSSYSSRHSDRYYDSSYRRGYYGREVKGRGSTRYYDSRRSRSNTPPHWRKEQSKLKSLEVAQSEATKQQDDSDPEEGQILDSEDQANNEERTSQVISPRPSRSRSPASSKNNEGDIEKGPASVLREISCESEKSNRERSRERSGKEKTREKERENKDKKSSSERRHRHSSRSKSHEKSEKAHYKRRRRSSSSDDSYDRERTRRSRSRERHWKGEKSKRSDEKYKRTVDS